MLCAPQGRKLEWEMVRELSLGRQGQTPLRTWYPTRMEENIENTYFSQIYSRKIRCCFLSFLERVKCDEDRIFFLSFPTEELLLFFLCFFFFNRFNILGVFFHHDLFIVFLSYRTRNTTLATPPPKSGFYGTQIQDYFGIPPPHL